MIYFDKKTLSILRYIKRKKDKGATWGELQKKFGEDHADILLLQHFSEDLYTLTKDGDGNWIDFKKWSPVSGKFRSFCTTKGNEFIERRSFDFWKWVIPTLISVTALVVSVLSA